MTHPGPGYTPSKRHGKGPHHTLRQSWTGDTTGHGFQHPFYLSHPHNTVAPI